VQPLALPTVVPAWSVGHLGQQSDEFVLASFCGGGVSCCRRLFFPLPWAHAVRDRLDVEVQPLPLLAPTGRGGHVAEKTNDDVVRPTVRRGRRPRPLRCWAVGPEVERGAGQAERVSLEKGKRPGEGWIALLWSPAAHPTPSCSASTGPSCGGARGQGRGVGGTQEEGDQFAGNEPGSTLERTSSTVIDSPSSPSNSRPAIIASSYDALRGPPPPPCRRNGDSTEH